MTERAIDNSDLWAAIRGLRMYRMSRDELIELHDEHCNSPLFASRVIAEAALQVACTKVREQTR
jgi:hypothetical protein